MFRICSFIAVIKVILTNDQELTYVDVEYVMSPPTVAGYFMFEMLFVIHGTTFAPWSKGDIGGNDIFAYMFVVFCHILQIERTLCEENIFH